jgi:two-component system, sensor histidine kinase PdtaS
MKEYVNELITYLKSIFSTGGRIQFKINIDSIRLEINQTISIGLILNEAITNSIEYAFSTHHISCSIMVDTHVANNELVNLLIRDNGVGFTSENLKTEKLSLGMRLMRGLTEDLSGSFNLFKAEGTAVRIEFRINNLSQNQVA